MGTPHKDPAIISHFHSMSLKLWRSNGETTLAWRMDPLRWTGAEWHVPASQKIGMYCSRTIEGKHKGSLELLGLRESSSRRKQGSMIGRNAGATPHGSAKCYLATVPAALQHASWTFWNVGQVCARMPYGQAEQHPLLVWLVLSTGWLAPAKP